MEKRTVVQEAPAEFESAPPRRSRMAVEVGRPVLDTASTIRGFFPGPVRTRALILWPTRGQAVQMARSAAPECTLSDAPGEHRGVLGR